MIAGAGLLGLGVAAKDPAWIVAWFSLALGAVGACEGSFWSTAVEVGGRLGGTTAAIGNTRGNGGGILAPVITPWGKKDFYWPIGIRVRRQVCLPGALCWVLVTPAG